MSVGVHNRNCAECLLLNAPFFSASAAADTFDGFRFVAGPPQTENSLTAL